MGQIHTLPGQYRVWFILTQVLSRHSGVVWESTSGVHRPESRLREVVSGPHPGTSSVVTEFGREWRSTLPVHPGTSTFCSCKRWACSPDPSPTDVRGSGVETRKRVGPDPSTPRPSDSVPHGLLRHGNSTTLSRLEGEDLHTGSGGLTRTQGGRTPVAVGGTTKLVVSTERKERQGISFQEEWDTFLENQTLL